MHSTRHAGANRSVPTCWRQTLTLGRCPSSRDQIVLYLSLEYYAVTFPRNVPLSDPAGRQSEAAPECPRAPTRYRNTMFGNMTASALSILQKTYDESYLTCSTAVYYESQVSTGQHL